LPLLPSALIEPVLEALRAAGDPTPIRAMSPVKGGFVSHALRLTTGRASYFLKWTDRPAHGRYGREARGLALFAQTGTVRVPTVLAARDATAEAPGFLLQEWLRPPPREQALGRTGDRLGVQVAALHRVAALDGRPLPGYGFGLLDGDGAEPWDADWATCYGRRCLEPAIAEAATAGQMSLPRQRALDALLARLDDWLGAVARQPSLLHGDLWRNNVLCAADGALVLIDPRPYLGDREAELAYAEWGGGFGLKFYAAYEEAWPLPPGREERRDLYLIWYMLRNLAHGELRRGAAIDSLLHRYVGRGA
jgi:fructosamine-3-kinase